MAVASAHAVQSLRPALLAAGGFVALHLGLRTARELVQYRRSLSRLRTEWTSIPGVAGARALRVHTRVAGHQGVDTPTAVLVHGYGIGSSYFVPLAARLAQRMRVHAPDLPGHGFSDHDLRPLTIPELGEALGRWMDRRRLRSVLLAGHSMGCQVVVELAARRPDLVSALLLIGPASDPAARSVTQLVARGLVTSCFERPSFFVWGARDYALAGLRVLACEVREMIGHRLEDVLPRVDVPVRVVRGARDYLVSNRWAAQLSELFLAPAPIVIPGWGHAVQYDEPDRLAEVVFALALRPALAKP